MEGTALKQLQATCTALKDEIKALYEQRGARYCDELRMKQRRWCLLLHLSAMKSGLRDTFLESDARRTRVQEQKNVAETHQLQLQNLLYEKDHLLREIQRCRGFSTKEMDKIEFEDGPLPFQVDANLHRQHLNQLTQELHARKRLQTELKEIKATIATIKEATETKQTFLDALPDQLVGIEAATMGLQKYMGQTITTQRASHRQAETELPTPLYALYCELEAYQTASGQAGEQLQIGIVDSIGLKQTTASRKRGFPAALERQDRTIGGKRHKTLSRSPSTSVTVATLPTGRGPSRSSSVKGGVDTLAQEPEIGEVIVASTAEKLLELRPQKEETKEEVSLVKRLEDEDTDSKLLNLWEPHAKALQLLVSIATLASPDNGSATFTVMFQYFPVVKMVTAEVVKTVPTSSSPSSHQCNILTNLFPGDDGRTVPQLVVNYAFQDEADAWTEITFPNHAAGRPYYWVQWICGLNPVKRPDPIDRHVETFDHPPRRRPEPSIRNVMNQLVQRFVATAVLNTHLDQLANATSHSTAIGSVSVHPLARHLFPREIKAHLNEWIEIPTPSQDVFLLFRESSRLFKQPRAQCHLSTTGCRYFRAGFHHGQSKVSAIVEISPEYPIRAPRFLFQPRSLPSSRAMDKEHLLVYETQLKELEIEVNAYYDELIPRNTEHFLLLHQLRKIEMCFDVLCNATADGTTDMSLCFGRDRRGKDRRQAMVMDMEAKALRHR